VVYCREWLHSYVAMFKNIVRVVSHHNCDIALHVLMHDCLNTSTYIIVYCINYYTASTAFAQAAAARSQVRVTVKYKLSNFETVKLESVKFESVLSETVKIEAVKIESVNIDN
jgi:hypothetical protein